MGPWGLGAEVQQGQRCGGRGVSGPFSFNGKFWCGCECDGPCTGGHARCACGTARPVLSAAAALAAAREDHKEQSVQGPATSRLVLAIAAAIAACCAVAVVAALRRRKSSTAAAATAGVDIPPTLVSDTKY